MALSLVLAALCGGCELLERDRPGVKGTWELVEVNGRVKDSSGLWSMASKGQGVWLKGGYVRFSHDEAGWAIGHVEWIRNGQTTPDWEGGGFVHTSTGTRGGRLELQTSAGTVRGIVTYADGFGSDIMVLEGSFLIGGYNQELTFRR